MKRQSYWLEQSRGSLLDSLADAIENHHKQRRKLETEVDPAVGATDSDGDFLHDFMHLNVQYLNHLARLGSNYSIIASRALERLYDHWVPQDEIGDPPTPVVTETGAAESGVQAIRLTNEGEGELRFTIRCSEFRVMGPFDQSAVEPPTVMFRYGPCLIAPATHLVIAPRSTLELSLCVELSSSAIRGATYTTQVTVLPVAPGQAVPEVTPASVSVRRPER